MKIVYPHLSNFNFYIYRIWSRNLYQWNPLTIGDEGRRHHDFEQHLMCKFQTRSHLQTKSSDQFDDVADQLHASKDIAVYLWILHHFRKLKTVYSESLKDWKILWSSYRKLALVGADLTTTEFRSDTLTR